MKTTQQNSLFEVTTEGCRIIWKVIIAESNEVTKFCRVCYLLFVLKIRKSRDSWKRCKKHKMYFIFSTAFVRNISQRDKYLAIFSRDVHRKVRRSLSKNVRCYSTIITQVGICWQIITKLYDIKFHEHLFSCWAVTCAQTGRYGTANRCMFTKTQRKKETHTVPRSSRLRSGYNKLIQTVVTVWFLLWSK
jgi:hypothetical protein